MDESKFYLGIDIGNASSAMAYFDINRNVTEIIDISGGYGKPSVPTVIQYIPENNEWVFGEYAILNSGSSSVQEITLSSLVSRLGEWGSIDLDHGSIRVSEVLSKFVAELVSNVKNLNPKADIAGIIVSVPAYLGSEAKKELAEVFRLANLYDRVLDFVSDRESALYLYYFTKNEAKKERILLLDYGSRELRGSVYETDFSDQSQLLRCIASLSDKNGTSALEGEVYKLLEGYLLEQLKQSELNFSTQCGLNAFIHQHKDLLFQAKLTKPLKLYFSFIYPPFQRTVSKNEIEDLLRPNIVGFRDFIRRLLGRNLYDGLPITKIDTILFTGGGFEMPWARQAVTELLPEAKVFTVKNAKFVFAEGASVLAALKAKAFAEQRRTEKNPPDRSLIEKGLLIEDLHKLLVDIGIVLKKNDDRFIPIIERESFWWQEKISKSIIINESISEDHPASVGIYQRSVKGEVRLLMDLTLSLPPRPKGTTRLQMSLYFKGYNELIANFMDLGFGEFFPKTSYDESFTLHLK